MLAFGAAGVAWGQEQQQGSPTEVQSGQFGEVGSAQGGVGLEFARSGNGSAGQIGQGATQDLSQGESHAGAGVDSQVESQAGANPSTVEAAGAESLSIFPHSETSGWWISGQANIINQWHPAFAAPYSGPNSFRSAAQEATSEVLTLYTGYEISKYTEVLFDLESAGGRGLSNALGLAGFTNLDVVRNPALGRVPYVARLMLHQIIPLSHEMEPNERGVLGLAASLPVRRIEFRIGKMSLVDFFDLNSAGSDSHLQFLNWVTDNSGTYDYAANTRGYTEAAVVEYDDHDFSLRFAEAMMPKVANGIYLDADLLRAHEETVEGEWREKIFGGQGGVVRLLGFVNHADMGSYREAVDDFLRGTGPGSGGARPSIIATREQGRLKYGFGLNFEQDLTSHFGVFGRLGWNDGKTESFVYTEVDRAFQIGAYFRGEWWRRKNDRAGAVYDLNGITRDHARYLELGGLGFLLGDGGLTYDTEKIFEGYYTAHLWRGMFWSFDLQHIQDPGYNEVRGPVLVPGLRLHVDF
jgi:high affinity Mn2+ porin